MGGKRPGRKTSNFLRMVGKRVAKPLMKPMVRRFKHFSLQCFGEPPNSSFLLANLHPSVLLNILTTYGVDPCDLARLEATCTYFKRGSNFSPGNSLSIPELAALDMCQKRTIFKSMETKKRDILKQNCGGSWKLVLKYLMAIEEASPRSGKSQVVAGCGHSVVVNSQGAVYSFGLNNFGQLGHGTYENEPHPRVISSLQGIRVVQAVVRHHKTMLVTDCGHVYASGITTFGESEVGAQDVKNANTKPQLVKPLESIFVVQIAIGQFHTVALSREGRVYSLSWGKENKLIHRTEPNDLEPYLLDGPLENIPVVQISAGYCYLLALAFQPTGLSVYSVGCGLGGKLGHGSTQNELKVRLVENLQSLNIKPVMIAAGSWHTAVVGKDGRVCTWGWGNYGCLGHGSYDFINSPKVVEGLKDVNIVDVATGVYTTFAVSDGGDVYSFGSDFSWNLGQIAENEVRKIEFLIPKIAAELNLAGDRIIQISPTNSSFPSQGHALALTESGKLYAFGCGENGQLGIKLPQNETKTVTPLQVDLDLS